MIIFIDGFWKDDGERFENYMVIVGKKPKHVEDGSVFFQFADWNDFKDAVMYGAEEFVINNIRR